MLSSAFADASMPFDGLKATEISPRSETNDPASVAVVPFTEESDPPLPRSAPASRSPEGLNARERKLLPLPTPSAGPTSLTVVGPTEYNVTPSLLSPTASRSPSGLKANAVALSLTSNGEPATGVKGAAAVSAATGPAPSSAPTPTTAAAIEKRRIVFIVFPQPASAGNRSVYGPKRPMPRRVCLPTINRSSAAYVTTRQTL